MDIQDSNRERNGSCIETCDNQCREDNCRSTAESPSHCRGAAETSNLNDRMPAKSLLDSFKAQPKDKCGYSCEFVEPPPTLLQSECSICLQILCLPHLISCCGHNYCKTCIEQVMEKSRPCPLCNEESFTVLHNKGLQRSLNELHVYCSNSKVGCEWKGRLGQLEQHLNEDPEQEVQLVGCSYVEVECKHGCGGRMRRGLISEHQNEQCPQRPFCCAYCREYDSIHADVVYRHWPVCRKYPMSCPNHCTVYAIERENMEEHLRVDCPLQKVSCEFSFAGCDIVLPREDLSDHLESNQIDHMTMLAAMNVRLNDDLVEKEEQIAKLSKDFGDQLALARAESQREIDSLRKANTLLKQEVNELKSHMTDLMASFKLAIDQLKESQSQQERDQKCQTETLRQEVTSLNIKSDATRNDLSQQCYSIQSFIGLFPVEFVMSNFECLRQNGIEWQSMPFYSHLEGYRLCLVAYPNGMGNAEGSYVSVYICLMQGEFDNKLRWPFRGAVTIQILNQLGDRIPATGTLRFTENTPSRYTSRVVKAERAEKGWGLIKFIRHEELCYNGVKNRQFLKDDCLRFRITKVELHT